MDQIRNHKHINSKNFDKLIAKKGHEDSLNLLHDVLGQITEANTLDDLNANTNPILKVLVDPTEIWLDKNILVELSELIEYELNEESKPEELDDSMFDDELDEETVSKIEAEPLSLESVDEEETGPLQNKKTNTQKTTSKVAGLETINSFLSE